MRPNPNLWSVVIVSTSGLAIETLWICGATADIASRKVIRFARRKYGNGMRVRSVESQGGIDVF